ncbi:TIGR04063 family PEP-CTERM/XrtA system glycosyltransferase [Aquisediminimonas sediminicola]|uniref:TIGR04063 family PEP-CTERM/XrtA system glycosyltransferase n=1 Tax=Alteraquisediminimonas sediminicola TaxID=2676787 RepID=UPI001C8D0115|nr:TIGR04063 family PEP-CTERM/XrtA system glycosyltransferase [Aquisediminimonas sediminicola]
MSLRILHVLDHSLPMFSGYSFRTRAILKAQQALGWTVAGLTGVRHDGGGLAEAETVDGIDFFRTTPRKQSGCPFIGPLWSLFEVLALRRRTKALIRDWRPDLVHIHSPVLNALGAMAVAQAKGLPVLYEIRAFWEDAAVGNGTGREGSLRYRLTRWLETRAVRKADAVAVICDGLRQDLLRRGIDDARIMVSPNGVDMAMFGTTLAPDCALAQQMGIDGAEVIGFIGSFYDYEGLDILLAAMPALVAARPGLHLVLVGGGPMEGALHLLAQASPVAAHIHFIGRVPHDEVARYYGLMDVLVFPRKAMRLTELVTPLKPLEAMAQGKLVAASDVGGHRELIRDGETGTLFPPDDPPALATAVADMFADRAHWATRRLAAREFVARERNWSSNISRYKPVYERLLGRMCR